MKTKDWVWVLILLGLSTLIVIPVTRGVFETLTKTYPYVMGFIKTAILATMGERLVIRIKTGYYFHDQGIIIKSIIWGVLGVIFVLIFKVFPEGVKSAQMAGLLPTIQNSLANRVWLAFITSLLMNIFFAPSFMLMHRITDAWIDLSKGTLKGIDMTTIIKSIDFQQFIRFICFKTIPLFWIPAHTITFLLPDTYRVLMAAYLSIALGLILTLSKLKLKP